MGIPSLNSAILYNVSLYFQSNHANIIKLTTPVHENSKKAPQHEVLFKMLYIELKQTVDDRFYDSLHYVVSVWTRMQPVVQTVVRMQSQLIVRNK